MGLFATLFGDVERRTHPSNPANWLLYALGGGTETSAGIKVDEETAMRLTAVYACVRILAESVSSLPLILYRRKGKGKERADDHPLYSIMHDQPNPEMTSMVFRETSMGHLGLWGNSYSGKASNGAGKVQLWPLRPDKIEVKRIDGNLWYLYNKSGGIQPIPRRDILHIPGLSYNGISGLSPIGQAREAIGIAFGAEETAARFYGQGMRAGGVFTHPEQLGKDALENLKQSIKDSIGGSGKFHNPLVLEEGMKWEQLTIPPNDAQFIETRKWQLEEVARCYRVPLHLLGHLDRMSYNNVEQLGIDFVVHTLRPWLIRTEQNYNQQLLTEKERKAGYFFEHKIDGLLRGDSKSRNESYATAVQWGWMSRNDVRELENLNPQEGLDTYLVPLNMISAEAAEAQPMEPPAPPQNEDEEDSERCTCKHSIEQRNFEGEREEKAVEHIQRLRESFHQLFKDGAQRVINKEVKAIQRAAKKYLNRRSLRNVGDMKGWLQDFYAAQPDYIKEIMGPIFASYAETFGQNALDMIGVTGELPAQFTQHMDEYLEVYAKREIGSSKGQLDKLLEELSPDEVLDGLVTRTDEWLETRADKIAEYETGRLINYGNMDLWQSFGITKMRWVLVGKNCPYCEKVANTDYGMGRGIVSMKKPFVSGPIHVPYTVDLKDADGNVTGQQEKWSTLKSRTIFHPPLHPGCDCTTLPAF